MAITTRSRTGSSPDLSGSLDQKLTREWLLTDGLGGFASGSIVGCPTRRYHGLLVASKRPPLERFLLLAGTLDRLQVGSREFELSTFEFNGVFHPHGYRLLSDVQLDIAQPDPWIEFSFSHDLFEARKRITLLSRARAVRLNFEVIAKSELPVVLDVCPLVSLRDFHGFRRINPGDSWDTYSESDAVWFHSHEDPEVTLAVIAAADRTAWLPKPVWWQAFRYRAELERGFHEHEDLLNAGSFRTAGDGGAGCELTAVGFRQSLEAARNAADDRTPPSVNETLGSAELRSDSVAARLVLAGDQFVVHRADREGHSGAATVIAGYPWFGDWGRDSFISLEGLLLIPQRFSEAREVLSTFSSAQRNGLIPNRFDDYGGDCAYNSVDASLWFIHEPCQGLVKMSPDS